MPITTSSTVEPLIIDGGVRRIELTGRIDDGGQLRLHYGDINLHDHGATLVQRVTADSPVELVVSDFVHDGMAFRVHCFSIADGADLIPWGRGADGKPATSMFAPDGAGAELRFVVIGVRQDGQQTVVDHYPIARVDRMGNPE